MELLPEEEVCVRMRNRQPLHERRACLRRKVWAEGGEWDEDPGSVIPWARSDPHRVEGLWWLLW